MPGGADAPHEETAMIGAYAEYAPQFLLVYVAATTVAFALPIFLVPLGWARIMRFTVPADTDLAVYFGRCLGAVILVLEGVTLRAAVTGEAIRFVFELLIAVVVLMIVVHAYGAVRRIQPITETLEIGVWVLILALGLAFFPAGAPAS